MHFLTLVFGNLVYKHSSAPTVILVHSHFHRGLLLLVIVSDYCRVKLRKLLKLSS